MSGEWEDLATSNTLQWSPTLISDKQKEKERLTRLVHARNIKTDRLLRENATWQHEKHLALTRPDLQERTSCRKTSGMISCGLFIPGKVQSSVATESMSTSKFRPKRQGRLNSVWFPSAPPHEVLRPVSRSFQAEEDATQIASNLKRTMAVPISPPLRPPDLADETDAVLWCSPMQAQEPSRFGICPVEPTLPNRPKTTPTTSRQGQLGHLGHLGHPGLEGTRRIRRRRNRMIRRIRLRSPGLVDHAVLARHPRSKGVGRCQKMQSLAGLKVSTPRWFFMRSYSRRINLFKICRFKLRRG